MTRFARGFRHAAMTAACLVACEPSGENLELPPVTWEGEYLTFGASERAAEYCAGTPAYLDAYVGGLVAELDRPPLAEKVRYSLLARDEVPGSEEGVLGTSTSRGVLSGDAVLEHELVHAVLRPNGLTHPVLEEGLAEYFGGDGYFSFREDTGLPLEDALDAAHGADYPGEYYGVAGRFVSYIDTMFGRELLLELEDRLTWTSSTIELEAAFSEAIGLPFDEAAEEFTELEACPQHVYWDPSPACLEAAPLAWCDGSETAEHTVDLTCGSPDVIGVRDGEIWAYRLVNIPTPGMYGLYISPLVDEPAEGYAELKQCVGGCGSFLLRELIPTGLRPATWFEVEEPGDYILKLAIERSAERTIRFQILGIDCE